MKNKQYKWNVTLLGDHAVLFSLPEQINHETANEVQLLNGFIHQQQYVFIKDTILSYHTIVVIYDILLIESNPITTFNLLIENYYEIKNKLTIDNRNKTIVIPVCYDMTFGLDLQHIADTKKISIEDIIKIHTAQTYDVYAIGFLPGFTYMGKVHESIQMPRHSTPRKSILAGSVGIAGMQTGVYPTSSPGGWQIIGRTPLKMFSREKLSFCSVGDVVQFIPIDLKTFNNLNEY